MTPSVEDIRNLVEQQHEGERVRQEEIEQQQREYDQWRKDQGKEGARSDLNIWLDAIERKVRSGETHVCVRFSVKANCGRWERESWTRKTNRGEAPLLNAVALSREGWLYMRSYAAELQHLLGSGFRVATTENGSSGVFLVSSLTINWGTK